MKKAIVFINSNSTNEVWREFTSDKFNLDVKDGIIILSEHANYEPLFAGSAAKFTVVIEEIKK